MNRLTREFRTLAFVIAGYFVGYYALLAIQAALL